MLKSILKKVLYIQNDVDEKISAKIFEESLNPLLSFTVVFDVVPNAFIGLDCTEHTHYDLLVASDDLPNLSARNMLMILRNIGVKTPMILIIDELDQINQTNQGFARVAHKEIRPQVFSQMILDLLCPQVSESELRLPPLNFSINSSNDFNTKSEKKIGLNEQHGVKVLPVEQDYLEQDDLDLTSTDLSIEDNESINQNIQTNQDTVVRDNRLTLNLIDSHRLMNKKLLSSSTSSVHQSQRRSMKKEKSMKSIRTKFRKHYLHSEVEEATLFKEMGVNNLSTDDVLMIGLMDQVALDCVPQTSFHFRPDEVYQAGEGDESDDSLPNTARLPNEGVYPRVLMEDMGQTDDSLPNTAREDDDDDRIFVSCNETTNFPLDEDDFDFIQDFYSQPYLHQELQQEELLNHLTTDSYFKNLEASRLVYPDF